MSSNQNKPENQNNDFAFTIYPVVKNIWTTK